MFVLTVTAREFLGVRIVCFVPSRFTRARPGIRGALYRVPDNRRENIANNAHACNELYDRFTVYRLVALSFYFTSGDPSSSQNA